MFRAEKCRGWIHRARLTLGLLLASGLLTTQLQSQTANWYPLFDGQTLQGWTTLDGQPVTRGWEVVDGMIHLNTSAGRGGQIVTDRDYGDFELLFEWKIAAGGNSGIKYRVRSFGGQMLGCEYQMIDDDNVKGLRPNQLTGSLYDLYAPAEPRQLNPAGQFNRGRVLVQGDRIEHWLNGRLMVSTKVGSRSWQEQIGASKFAERDGFGANRLGRIMLTDHGTEVWFRNLFLRPLPTEEACPTVLCRPVAPTISCHPLSLWKRVGRRVNRCR